MQSIMTAHIRVPALDDAPATLSPAVVTGLLRGELGYDGLVIADALEMKAVSATVGVARSAVLRDRGGRGRAADRPRPRRRGGRARCRARSSTRSPAASCPRRGSRGGRPRRAHRGVGRRQRRDFRRRRSIATPDWLVARQALVVEGDVALDGPRRSWSSCVRARTSPPARRSTRSEQLLAQRRPQTESLVVRDGERVRGRGAARSWSWCATRTGIAWMREAVEQARERRDRGRARPAALAPARGARLRRHVRRQPRELRGARRPLARGERGARVTSPARAGAARAARGAGAAARAAGRRTRRELGALFHRPDVSYILIASRGSSSNAARYAQYLLGRANRVPVAFATPSLYTLYEQPPRLDGALVIGISQSGESPDVRAVIEHARRQGRPTIAITNRPGSPIGDGGRGRAAARGRRRAGGRGDEDVRQLARRRRAALRLGDRRRARPARARADARSHLCAARALVRRRGPPRRARGHRRRDGGRAGHQLRDGIRDRAEDPRALAACSSRPGRPPT